MLGFIIGVIVTAIFYTAFPSVAAVPSGWLRALWFRIRAPKAPPPGPTTPSPGPR